jgi:predicted nucleotidyltransferase
MHVFGSALRADFDPNSSDLDLLVEFKAIDSTQLVRAYFDLERQLLEITGKPVDLVMADAIHNRYVRADIEATKHLIYEAGPRPGIPGPIRPMSLMRAKLFKTLWPKSISTITAVAA